MKKVYFVRHGESVLNTENREQGPDGALSPLGRTQACFIGKRFSHIDIDLIVSSPHERTVETAEIINSTLGKEVVHSNFLIERRPPSRYIGVLNDDPEYVEIKKKIAEERMIDPTWKYEDGDSFNEIKERAIQSLKYLEERNEESILVVTHAGTIRAIVGVIIFVEEFAFADYRKMYRSLKTENTGITLVEYSDAQGLMKSGWKIITWNDHAHLG